MKTLLVPALVLAAVSAAALPAAAQSHGPARGHQAPHHQAPYVDAGYGSGPSINMRQASLDRRIDQGVRNGTLSRREATRLRSDFNGLLRLEASYRRGGLTAWERSDLDRRFDRLSARIRIERRDRDNHRG